MNAWGKTFLIGAALLPCVAAKDKLDDALDRALPLRVIIPRMAIVGVTFALWILWSYAVAVLP